MPTKKQDVRDYLAGHKGATFTTKALADAVGCSIATAGDVLRKMQARGEIIKIGKRNLTKWYVVNNVLDRGMQIGATPQELRAAAGWPELPENWKEL